MSLLSDPAMVWTLRLLLCGIFLLAAVSKLRARDVFEGILRDYRLLPEQLVVPFARLLPVVELLAALGLLFEPSRTAAALLIAGLLLVFIAAIAINLARGRREIDCGCFLGGRGRQRIGWSLVVRNLVLLAFALDVAAAGAPVRAITVLDVATVAGATLALLFAYFALSQLLETAPLRQGEAR